MGLGGTIDDGTFSFRTEEADDVIEGEKG